MNNSYDFFEHVLNSLEDTVYIFDAKTRVGVIWNKALEAISGYDYEKMRHFPPGHFYPQAEHDRIEQALTTLEEKGFAKVELSYIIADGSSIPFEYSVVPVTGPAGEKWICAIGRDISERRQAENDRENLLAELKRLSLTDPLTGIYNRRFIEQQIKAEIARNNRYGDTFSLIMFDIDLFKAVNDNHGHQVGDTVLCNLTALVYRHIRTSDMLARIGGEEFLILCPKTDLSSTRKMAEKLCLIINTTPLEAIKLSVSFGVATYQHCESFDQLFKRTDSQLYRAKRNGRNRVEG